MRVASCCVELTGLLVADSTAPRYSHLEVGVATAQSHMQGLARDLRPIPTAGPRPAHGLARRKELHAKTVLKPCRDGSRKPRRALQGPGHSDAIG